MSITGLAIIYIIIWWIVFFAILPIDVERKKLIKIDYHAVELYPLPWSTLKNLNFCNLINIDNEIFKKLHLNWNDFLLHFPFEYSHNQCLVLLALYRV